VLLSAAIARTPITARTVGALVVSYAGIVLVFASDFTASAEPRAVAIGGGLVFASAILYSLYLVQAGDAIKRLGSMRFIAWVMLASSVFVIGQFALTRPLAALAVPASIHALALTMAVFSTVLPTWLIAEAIRRMGANASSLVGSLGPLFTIGLGALILGEPLHWIQLAGAALVLTGVTLVTLER
jgi:drug/metabolite transporter (DMT)-like permease